MLRQSYLKTIILLNLAWLCIGCAVYRQQPIDAAAAARDFSARSLADAGLIQYLQTASPAAVTPDTHWPPDAIDLPTLTLIAWYFNPDLAVTASEAGEADAAAVTAQQQPNPSFTLSPVHNAGAMPWGLGLGLSIPIETAGKQQIRRVRAQSVIATARIRLAESSWQVRSRLRAAVVAYKSAQALEDLGQTDINQQLTIVHMHEQLVSQGWDSRGQLIQAQADLSRLRLEHSITSGLVITERNKLIQVLGLTSEAWGSTTMLWDGLFNPPCDLPCDNLREIGLLNRLDLRRLLALYDTAETNLELAIAQQYPDIRFLPSWSWNKKAQQFTFGLSFEIPLHGNRGPIAEARAQRQTAAARFLALQDQIIGDIDKARCAYQSACETVRLAAANQDEQHRVLERVQRLQSRGTGDALSVALAQRQCTVAQKSYLQAVRDLHLAISALEDAVQRPLIDSEAPPANVVAPSLAHSTSKELP